MALVVPNPHSNLDSKPLRTIYLVGVCSSRAAVVPQLPGSLTELVAGQLGMQAAPLLLTHAVLLKALPPKPLGAEETHLLQACTTQPLEELHAGREATF